MLSKRYRHFLRERTYLRKKAAEINKHLPCKDQTDIDALAALIEETCSYRKDYPHYQLYWDREVYIDAGFDGDRCSYIMCFDKNIVVVAKVDDMVEHPGLTVTYKFLVGNDY